MIEPAALQDGKSYILVKMVKFYFGLGFVLLSMLLNVQGCTNLNYAPIDKKQAGYYNAQLGLAYLQKNDRVRAKAKLGQALNLAPKSAFVNNAMAYFMEQTGDIPNARLYYQKAVHIAPKKGIYLNNYAVFLCKQAQYKQAYRFFERAVCDVHYANTALAYENAGLCAMEHQDNDYAKQLFKTALQHDPTRTHAREMLVELQQLSSKNGTEYSDDHRHSNK